MYDVAVLGLRPMGAMAAWRCAARAYDAAVHTTADGVVSVAAARSL